MAVTECHKSSFAEEMRENSLTVPPVCIKGNLSEGKSNLSRFQEANKVEAKLSVLLVERLKE